MDTVSARSGTFFPHEQIDALPGAAWSLVVCRPSGHVSLVHGSAVEVGDGLFFEGVWDGSWDRPPTCDSVLFGTGGRVDGESVEIYASSFKLHGVFALDTPNRVFVSNSLPLLLAQSGRSLRPDYQYVRHYRAAVSLAWRGIASGLNAMPLATANETIKIYPRCRLTIQARPGGVLEAVRNFGPRFGRDLSFAEYRDALESSLLRMVANASAPGRKHPMKETIVAMSAGYDSTAAAVIAKKVGCTRGATIDAAAGDSGEQIGERLGFRMHVVPVASPGSRNELASVLCMPGNIVHAPWFSLKPYFHDRLVITGWHGDTNWGLRASSHVDGEFASVIGMGGLPEARLWMGCAFVALPAVGDGDQQNLVAMSRGAAMAPYRTGDEYDRPIPRRIAIDASLEPLLARSKKGTSAHVIAHTNPEVAAEVERLDRGAAIAPLPTEYLEAEAREFAVTGWTATNVTFDGSDVVTRLREAYFRWGLDHLVCEYSARLRGPHAPGTD